MVKRLRRQRTAKKIATLDKDDDGHNIQTFIGQQVDKFFIEHLPMPSLSEMPSTYMYYFGTVAYMAMIAIFIYFVDTSYRSSVNQAFIALDPSSGDCSPVPISITQTFLADNTGDWIGTPDFDFSDGLYSISLSNFQGSYAQYAQMMETFRSSLQEIGQRALQHSVAYNLLMWSSYIRYYSTEYPLSTNLTSVGLGQLQYIQMTGNPSVIFGTNQHQGVFSSQYGICDLLGYTSYDLANSAIITELNYSVFIQHRECTEVVLPQMLGYSSAIDNNVFTVGIDVRSFATAMSVNWGILALDDLGSASSEVLYIHYNNYTFQARQYFDLRYELMSPILCLRNLTVLPPQLNVLRQLCFYIASETVAVPVYSHFGASEVLPEYCDCNTYGHDAACQQFNLLSSLVFFPSSAKVSSSSIKTTIVDELLFSLIMVSKYDSYHDFNKAAFNASWSAAAQAYNKRAPETRTAKWQESAFAFCTISHTQSCSMITFNSYSPVNQLVSPFKYQLVNGSCRDSFTIPDEYWNNMVVNTPAQLTQPYYECYPSPDAAFFNALGIASGNTQLAVPLAVLGTIPLLYLLLLLLGQVPPKEEYSNQEKAQVMDIFSIILLRLRDGKSRGFKRRGVLLKMIKELISAAKEEVGYPDSDDDEDEDDEDDEDDDGDEDENGGEAEDSDDDEDEYERQTSFSTAASSQASYPLNPHAVLTHQNSNSDMSFRASYVIDSDDELESPPAIVSAGNSPRVSAPTAVNGNSNSSSRVNSPSVTVSKSSKAAPKASSATKASTVGKDGKKKSAKSSPSAASKKTLGKKVKVKKVDSAVAGGSSDAMATAPAAASHATGFRARRTKMEIFTRQLVEAPTPTHTPVRRLSAVHNLLGLAPSANHHHSHPDVESGESSHPATTNKPPSHHSTSGGIFSSIQSMFSGESSASRAKSTGGANGDMVRASEMGAELSILHRAPTKTTHGKVFFRPIDRLPPDAIVLNQASDITLPATKEKNKIRTSAQLLALVDDLLREVSTVFTVQPPTPSPPASSVSKHSPPSSSQEAQTALLLQGAQALASRLRAVEHDLFVASLLGQMPTSGQKESGLEVDALEHEALSKLLALKLANALRLHASVALSCELRHLEHGVRAETVGYDIGGRFVTAPQLLSLL